MRTLLDAAAADGYAIAAFNVNDLEQVQAVMEAASQTGSPVIIQATVAARRYAGDAYLRALIEAAARQHPSLPIAFHHDHGTSPQDCISAIKAGFTSVMMDGSLHEDGKTPTSFEYNVAVTRVVVERAHAVGVTVEGELGRIGGIEDGHGTRDVALTDPDQAVEFVERTGVDALAVAIGTSHGAYKFARRPDRRALAMSRLAEIHRRLPDQHLVLHGASTVPSALVEDVNSHGGAVDHPWGVPVSHLQRALQSGVRKINVDTDLRFAMTAGLRRYLMNHPETIDPRAYMGAARQSMMRMIRQRMIDLGQAGQATRVYWDPSAAPRGAPVT
jgi:fructose-bisphosphate aldolase, class II